MFEVLVLVCLASNPNTCFEMEEAIEAIPDHVPQAYKCIHNEIKTPGIAT